MQMFARRQEPFATSRASQQWPSVSPGRNAAPSKILHLQSASAMHAVSGSVPGAMAGLAGLGTQPVMRTERTRSGMSRRMDAIIQGAAWQ